MQTGRRRNFRCSTITLEPSAVDAMRKRFIGATAAVICQPLPTFQRSEA